MTDRLAELTAGTGISTDDDDLVEININDPDEDELEKETNEALQRFRKETDALSKAIDKIHENVETVESRYRISLSEHVEESDKICAGNDIARLLDQTEKTSEAIRKRLRRIAGENNTFASENRNKTGELRIRVNTHQGLTRRFMDAMQLFEESQEKHRDNVKEAMERQLRLMNPQATEDDIQEALRRGKTDVIVDNSPTLEQLPPEEQRRLRRGLEDLRSRNNDIKKLEESIIQLHQLFMDMQLLIETQGDLLNDIEYNIEDTKGKTEAGYQELVEARAHQKSANKKKFCIVFLLVIILLIIMIPVLVKFIPKWFPQTAETISNLPIIGDGANSTNTEQEGAPQLMRGESSTPVSVSIYDHGDSPLLPGRALDGALIGRSSREGFSRLSKKTYARRKNAPSSEKFSSDVSLHPAIAPTRKSVDNAKDVLSVFSRVPVTPRADASSLSEGITGGRAAHTSPLLETVSIGRQPHSLYPLWSLSKRSSKKASTLPETVARSSPGEARSPSKENFGRPIDASVLLERVNGGRSQGVAFEQREVSTKTPTNASHLRGAFSRGRDRPVDALSLCREVLGGRTEGHSRFTTDGFLGKPKHPSRYSVQASVRGQGNSESFSTTLFSDKPVDASTLAINI